MVTKIHIRNMILHRGIDDMHVIMHDDMITEDTVLALQMIF